MNTSKKGTKRNNKATKGINVLLLVMTLFLSVTGIQVQAADRGEDKIVLNVRIVKEDTSEDEFDTTTFSEAIVPEFQAVEAMYFEAAPEESDILDTLDENELYYFGECIEIEAGGESQEGKIAVASVLANRVNSSAFPNSYEAVVTQKMNGVYQFSSYSSSVWGKKEISEETYEAIRTVLTEGSNVGNATYFANLNKVKDGWFYTAQENGILIKVAEIGGHTFFRTE